MSSRNGIRFLSFSVYVENLIHPLFNVTTGLRVQVETVTLGLGNGLGVRHGIGKGDL